MAKENQRVTFSKELLKKAALVLCKDRKREDITVTALCKEAGVSRDTFYRHYSSVAEVFQEVFTESRNELSERIRDFGDPKTMKKKLIAYLNYIRDNELLFQNMLVMNSSVPEEMQSLLEDGVGSIASALPGTDEKEKDWIGLFIFAGSFAVMTEWARNMDSISTSELAEFILKCAGKLMR